jgi:hypothetical protein
MRRFSPPATLSGRRCLLIAVTDSEPSPILPTRPRRGFALLSALAGLIAALALAAVAGAQGEDTESIGKTKDTPKASCPKDPCQAVGSVTGFQTTAGSGKGLTTAREAGHLVAWQVNLSKPKGSQREFFGKFYKEEDLGTAPTARIAVLKPAKEEGDFTLKAQSPVVELSDELGTKPRFTLDEPISIQKGDIVALTVPTWAPDFAVDLSSKNVWRASREKGACENATDIKKGTPQEKVGSTRTYGCTYRGARILYSAYYVPS